MRYPQTHKAESRARILEAARQLFRREGFDRPSIDQVMALAGLTRGAFYAHFARKEALVDAVLEIESGLVRDLRGAADQDAVLAIVRHYLSPDQREDVAHGCPLVAHPVDAIRGGPGRQERYEARFFALVEALQAAGLTRDVAVEVAVLAVGAGLVSAAVGDPDHADLVSRVCTDAIVAKLSSVDGAPPALVP